MGHLYHSDVSFLKGAPNLEDNEIQNYPGKRPQTVSEDFKGKGGKDPVAAS